MAVLVVACGRYRELGSGFQAEEAQEAARVAVRELRARGVEARSFEGTVTERRLERAIRGVAKAARRGEPAGLVLIGMRMGGAFVVENGAFRKRGKPMRAFSAGRVGALGIGRDVPVVHVDYEWGERTPGPRGEPMDWKRWLADLARRTPRTQPRVDLDRLRAALRWRFGHPQIDPGNDCIWAKAEAGYTLVGRELGSVALAELYDPLGTRVLGLLELEPLGDGTAREVWRFASGAWPAGDFRASKLLAVPGDGGRWADLTLEQALQWPVAHDIVWKGFEAAPSAVSVPEAFRMAPSSGNEPAVYAATAPAATGGRQVVGWYGTSAGFVTFGPQNRLVATFTTNVPGTLHRAKP